jgi:hypothetical protein
MKIKKIVKIIFFFNQSGEHIASYMIHININKTK